MIEVIALVAFAIALMAFLNGRKTAERLDAELQILKAELQRLSTAGAVAGLDAAAEAGVETARAAETSKGDAIFGGPPREPADKLAAEEAAAGEGAETPASVVADAVVAQPKESLESRLGARWAVWVGGVALALGGVFMVKYSIDAGLLSPAVRLAMAALFALVLAAAGEVVRRRAVPQIAGTFRNAMIPGILTGAATVTLFAVVYAAYGIYGFIGPFAAFSLLALVSLATVALSLLYGQALAGLGLLASMLTPALVTSDAPNPWVLFGYLAIAWLATLCAARLRRWVVVPALGNVGLCLWTLAYAASERPFEVLPVVFAMLVMIAGIGLLWPGRDGAEAAGMPSPWGARPDEAAPSAWERVMAPPDVAITATAAVAATLSALAMVSPVFMPSAYAAIGFLVVVIGLATLGALRQSATYPALLAAVAALAGVWSMVAAGDLLRLADPSFTPGIVSVIAGDTARTAALILYVAFILLGAAALRLRLRDEPQLAILWAAIMAALPVALTALSLLTTGNPTFDPVHGVFALIAGLALLASAEWISRLDAPVENSAIPHAFLLAGSLGLFVVALHALTDGLATTLLIAAVGVAYVAATRLRRWPALPWMMAGAAIVVLARIAWEPTLVGRADLSTTPVFNALLAGYGIPALLLAVCAYELRAWPGLRIRNLIQALASLFALLTVAILVRHAMNGGVLDSSVPTLGEQSTYTLIAIGGSAILMTLDRRSPSATFRYGSMAVGILSLLSVLGAHLVGLNPYFTGERLGSIPVFDLLFIGYLLPALAYAGLAVYARGRRPAPYVTTIAVAGAVMFLAWATLSVRRFWQGESIADWKKFLQGETYTYSVVWLALGVALLAIGSRLDAKAIRIASAVLVFVAVLKVFLIDMANLEGFLRALSFIGLGGVLIGIGLFYQRILSGKGERPPKAPEDRAAPVDIGGEPGHTA